MLQFDPAALRRIREERGISQRKLSTTVTGDAARLCAYERGRSVPDLPTIGKIAEALGIEYTALIGWSK
ncbi:helix-turn-helix transcriptional regulator [Streptomyces sp. NPDC006798]|uniref:helix-turn-helix domain-containing protein n=1 Tax=Streptomyces sp. NPDC006798 TaxID=3155462 RepID=UPI0033F466ED